MKYSKLIWHPHLDINNSPMMDVNSEPLLVFDGSPTRAILHNDINMIIEDKEYLDEVLAEFENVLSDKEEEGSYSGEMLIFFYNKETCEVSIGNDIMAYFRTKDMYDMLKSFREYRDNYYSQR